MQTAEDVLDRFSGMITREQALAMANGGEVDKGNNRATSVAGLIKLMKAARSNDAAKPYSVDVEDTVYRVFNEVSHGSSSRRTVTLGNVGSTVNLSLAGSLSSIVDSRCIERGDVVMVRNASLDMATERLVGTRDTIISRRRPAFSGVTDFSKLRYGEKNIDVLGRVLEIGKVRHVSGLSASGQVAVADCKLADSRSAIVATMWGSSALACERMHAGDFVKIEFCSVSGIDSSLQVHAGDLSRVLVNSALGDRIAH